MSYIFCFFYELYKLKLSSFNISSVTNMNKMFYECYNLTELNISTFNSNNVTDIV